MSRTASSGAVTAVAVALLAGALVLTARQATPPRPRGDVAVSAPAQMLVPVAEQQRPASRGTARTATSTAGPAVSGAWVEGTARRTGIPATAVRAYGQATLRMSAEQPGCRLGWTTLAGIGYVESQHGTLGGRTLGEDGRSSSPIIGPALDGHLFAAVPATPESSRWHGDRRWDHAVGPMQFIPSTWARWASDGDGDGVRDPHDLFDAAWAAALYLCASGADLSTGAGWTSAVLGYNHSEEYVASVLVTANAYAAS